MVDEIHNVTTDQAQGALDSVSRMERAGWRRAAPPRWFGAGVAFFTACLFAIYALENPYPYIVFPFVGLAVFIAIGREKVGAYGRDFPTTTASIWAFVAFMFVMVVIFFGAVVVRRAYDAAWAPVAVGVLVGLCLYLANEKERRHYLTKDLTKAELGDAK